MMKPEFEVRKEKVAALRASGFDPYPAKVTRSNSVREVIDHFDEWSSTSKELTLVGRIMVMRVHGGMAFADIRDGSGLIQIQCTADRQGESFEPFTNFVDHGDFLQVTGTLFLTKRGQQTLAVTDWRLISKAVRPLPEKWHGLTDTETRFRKRYLDFLMNPEVRERMEKRSAMMTALRKFLDSNGFLEVETPTLQPMYGGGFARPFVTHHNALDADFYLRISDEMYLKRLIIGGFERVYEITKVFRNEGIDRDHNPEFTMFEAQCAYKDYNWGMDFFEELFEHVAQSVFQTTQIQYDQTMLEFHRPWKRMRLMESLKEIGEINPDDWADVDSAKAALRGLLKPQEHEKVHALTSLGEAYALAFEELVEEKLVQPTIIYDYPVEVSPLAKKAGDPRFAERFECFVMGSEVGNNYSELNDPIDLHQRFVLEKKKEEAGFDEAHQTDNEYLEAIEHGMPPTCGLGVGFDRMAMFMTNAPNMKEVIAFPTLRPEHHERDRGEDV